MMLRIAASLGMPLSDEQKALLDKLQTEQGNDSARVDENKQGSRQDEEAIAKNLYRILREFDDEKVEVIFSESFSGTGMGQAIMNRLLKAAGHKVIYLEN